MPSSVGVVSSGFDPVMSLSPALWLDAADTSTITASSGAVSEWRDKSGNSRHVSQATSSKQPSTGTRTQNGLNLIDFDGSDDLLVTGASAPNFASGITIFVVEIHDTFGTNDRGRIVDVTNGPVYYLYGIDGVNVQSFVTNQSGSNGRESTLYANTSGVFRQSSVRWWGATDTYTINHRSQRLPNNGSTIGTNASVASTSGQVIQIGGRASANDRNFDGAIGELIIFNRGLSLDEVQRVEQYLEAKWNSASPVSLQASLWLDASDASTLTLSGNAVSEWRDKSGNSRHVSQSTSGSRPTYGSNTLNGRHVLTFDGGDYLDGANTALVNGTDGTFSVFAVARTTTAASTTQSIIDSGNNVAQFLRIDNSAAESIVFYTNGNPVDDSSTSISSETYYVLSAICGTEDIEVWVNETTNGNTALFSSLKTNSNAFTVGAWTGDKSQKLTGDIAEIIIFPRTLYPYESAQIKNYLYNKWLPALTYSPSIWLDAADPATITSSSGAVSEWRDKSINGFHVSQATAIDQPLTGVNTLNGRNVIKFPDWQCFLKREVSTQIVNSTDGTYSAFAVARTNDSDNTYAQQIVDQGNEVSQFLRFAGTVQSIGWYYDSDPFFDESDTVTSGTYYYMSAVLSANNLEVFLNGVSNGGTALSGYFENGPHYFTVGAWTPTNADRLNGDIAEIIIYPNDLSTEERQDIEYYLSRKWGVGL